MLAAWRSQRGHVLIMLGTLSVVNQKLLKPRPEVGDRKETVGHSCNTQTDRRSPLGTQGLGDYGGEVSVVEDIEEECKRDRAQETDQG